MKKLLLVAAIGFTALLSSQAKAQVSLNVNIGTPQPQWYATDYYYAPQPQYRVVNYAPQRVVRRTVVYREAPRRVYRTRTYISRPRHYNRVERVRVINRGPAHGHGHGRGRH
ncbi:hypothetical protein [Pedobacter duraquae]|uniref:YXWGXW repeat-containing protein n=1 Tax=Pedobacter duraquae TaxID=425511 RepID=A0A4R6IGZ3_9SPHI|nr:hypothetical protein [Pedobacter duraquae]TDO21007.1 hypothetical protein CLV32_3645 [Pedobacter duraquae]